jgi:hypothetical protein
VDLIGIEPMTSSMHFGNVTQLIETRWYRPHSTPLITRKNAAIGPFWTFLIDPQKQKAGLWSVDFATNLCPCTAEVFCGNPYLIAVEGADKGAEIAQLHKNKHA